MKKTEKLYAEILEKVAGKTKTQEEIKDVIYDAMENAFHYGNVFAAARNLLDNAAEIVDELQNIELGHQQAIYGAMNEAEEAIEEILTTLFYAVLVKKFGLK